MIREAEFKDAKYFLEAAETFSEEAGLQFNKEDTADSLFTFMTSDRFKLFVRGDPAVGHCIIALIESIYCRSEITARVVTTGGKGGMKCFHHALRWAKDSGINLFSADSFLDERIETAYKRSGMKKADVLYVTRLNHGN